MSKNKSKKMKGPWIKKTCLDAALLETEVRDLAQDFGMDLRVSVAQSGHAQTFHWQFDDMETGKRILDYWPGNGTVMNSSRIKGKAENAWHALELANKEKSLESKKLAKQSAALVGVNLDREFDGCLAREDASEAIKKTPRE